MGKTDHQVVILGLGNILLGDEGVGVHVLRELERSFSFPPNVELLDGGAAGIDLLPAIEAADQLIVIDCLHGNLEPGTIVRIVPERIPDQIRTPLSLHEIDLMGVLTLARLHGSCPRTIILGIQPESEGCALTLTPKVENQIPRIVGQVLDELAQLGICPEN